MGIADSLKLQWGNESQGDSIFYGMSYYNPLNLSLELSLIPTPFGPRSFTFPPLPPSALKILFDELYYHEIDFIKVLPSLWQLRDASPLSQGLAFEVLCFAAGLKECVLFGWGDGRSEQDSVVGESWLKMVWTPVKALFRMNGLAEDEDCRRVAEFLDGCTIERAGGYCAPGGTHAGHHILYHPPASPALSMVLEMLPIPLGDEEFPMVEERLLAYILDYPFELPLGMASLSHDDARLLTVDYEISRTGPYNGTHYLGYNDAEHIRKAKAHHRKYAEKLEGIVIIGLGVNDEKVAYIGGEKEQLDMVKRSTESHEKLLARAEGREIEGKEGVGARMRRWKEKTFGKGRGNGDGVNGVTRILSKAL